MTSDPCQSAFLQTTTELYFALMKQFFASIGLLFHRYAVFSCELFARIVSLRKSSLQQDRARIIPFPADCVTFGHLVCTLPFTHIGTFTVMYFEILTMGICLFAFHSGILCVIKAHSLPAWFGPPSLSSQCLTLKHHC